ncbi:hypothetical protein [Streptomyces sp. NPDC086838]
MSLRSIGEDEGQKENEPDPLVNVRWHCPNITCEGHDGFYIEKE